MALNISEFLSKMNAASGFAQQNRYEVTFPTRQLGENSTKIYKAITSAYNNLKLSNGGKSIESLMDWMTDFFDASLEDQSVRLSAFCEKSELPSYQFQLETVRHYGPQFKIPHMPEYQDTTMTFLCGADMYERYFFDAWMYMIMDPMSNDFNYKKEYAVDIDIVQYKDFAKDHTADGYVIDMNYYTTLIDAFPVAINTQELGYDINNSIQKVQVTFSYKYAVPYIGKGSSTGASLHGNQKNFESTIKEHYEQPKRDEKPTPPPSNFGVSTSAPEALTAIPL